VSRNNHSHTSRDQEETGVWEAARMYLVVMVISSGMWKTTCESETMTGRDTVLRIGVTYTGILAPLQCA